jgi:hypothetical protein
MNEDKHVRPTSPWMPFPILISVLSKVLPSLDIALICKFYKAKKVNVCFVLFSTCILVLIFIFLMFVDHSCSVSCRKERSQDMN